MFLSLKSSFFGTLAFTYRAKRFCISKKFLAAMVVDITKDMEEAKDEEQRDDFDVLVRVHHLQRAK